MGFFYIGFVFSTSNPVQIDTSAIKKILVIKLRAIGDVVLSTAVLPNLRRAFPDAQIDFLTERPSREVVTGNPYLNDVIIFDNTQQRSLGLLTDVRKRNYDLVIDLFGNPRSALVTRLSGARYRVGYRFRWRKYCYNIVVEPRSDEVHNAEFNLDSLRAIDVPIVDSSIFFPITEMAEKFAHDFFLQNNLDGQFVVALNPGGGWYTKRWRTKQYAELADLLVREWNARVLILWGPGEQNVVEEIQSRMKSKALVIPPTTLQQLGALLKRCSILVTNDSGPMHIAAAVGIPIVAIFGPTRPELQGPLGEKKVIVRNERLVCLGCNFTECPIDNPCMEELTVQEVFDACTQLVESHHRIQLQTT